MFAWPSHAGIADTISAASNPAGKDNTKTMKVKTVLASFGAD